MARKAFTLIELLVVIAIIAILAAILFPVFAQAKESAKDAQVISNAKQHGLAQLMYSNDADDNFALTLRISTDGTFDTWQGLVQPYMKNWGIVQHPKLKGFPADRNSAAWYYQSRAHWAMPLRALAHTSVPATTGYFTFRSASMTGGQDRRFDGIGGAAMANFTWGNRKEAPSMTTTSVSNPSDTIMIAEGGMWDFGWGFVGASNPMNYFWTAGTWVNAALNVFSGTNYIGPHGRKGKIKCSGGDDPKGADGFPSCDGTLPWVDGSTTFVATDGSAKSVKWRGGITGGTDLGGGAFALKHLWPN